VAGVVGQTSAVRYPGWRRRYGRRGHGCSRKLCLLETGPAQDRPPLCRPEGNGGFHSAGRTRGSGFRSYPGATVGALRLAWFATLGVVFEVFVVKEELLACCKDEFGAAINTLQYFVCEFHGRLPRTGNHSKSAMTSESAGPVSLSSYAVHNKGPGRISLAAKLVSRESEDRGDAAPSSNGAKVISIAPANSGR
jgi:hypothetical protein